jgi:exodeoxyribonuclease-5
LLTPSQQNLQQALLDRFADEGFPLNMFDVTINGYAGTGKTFFIANFRKTIHKYFTSYKNRKLTVAFCTFTGKASSVIEQKLREQNARFEQDYVGTIHGLIYEPRTRWDKNLKKHVIVGWRKISYDGLAHIDLIIIDEASMVPLNIYRDLIYYQIPIILIGDHGQLPPIGIPTNLIQDAEFTLTEIHRQALNSPIIKLAHYVRQNGHIPFNRMFSNSVFKIGWGNPKCQELFHQLDHEDDMIVLCGFNKTRVKLNQMIREKFNNTRPEPYVGEKVICLRNNKITGIMNGQIGRVRWAMPAHDDDFMKLTVDMQDFGENVICDVYVPLEPFNNPDFDYQEFANSRSNLYKPVKGLFNIPQEETEFIDLFDFGYAISVHKSQGSEWRRVVLFEQYCNNWQGTWNRWLYTAVTRAKEKLFIITDYY